jgi:hypothetical protein
MEVGVVPPRPINDHELTIARIVDKLSTAGGLHASAIDEIIAALDFALSIAETKFLVSYLRWRMENPNHEAAGLTNGLQSGRPGRF